MSGMNRPIKRVALAALAMGSPEVNRFNPVWDGRPHLVAVLVVARP